MEGILRVTPEQLEAASGEFSAKGTQLGSLTAQMTQTVESLGGVWEGEAALAYANRFRRLDIAALRQLIFGKDDPMPAVRVAADRHRHFFQFRLQKALHRGVKAVAVTMKDDPLHIFHLPSEKALVKIVFWAYNGKGY